MNTYSYYAYIFIILSATFLQVVYSIKCFQCSSLKDKGCAHLTSNDTHSEFYQECQPEGDEIMFCRKTSHSIMDKPDFFRITRACGWIPYRSNETSNCRKSDTDFRLETSCQCFSNACNSAQRVLPTAVKPLSLTIAIAVLMFILL